MHTEIRCGKQTLAVDLPRKSLRSVFRAEPAAIELADVLADQFTNPLDAPPLNRALAPGDRITVVVDHLVPAKELLLAAVARQIRAVIGTDGELCVLLTEGASPELMEELQQTLTDCGPVQVAVHHAANTDEHAYLASTQNGQRIYLNRRAADADAVVVVGRVGYDPLVGIRGTSSDLFPGVSNEEAQLQAQLKALDAGFGPEELRQRQGCDEVGWLSGLFYALAVTVNADGDVDNVWFGRHEAVHEAALQHLKDQWTVTQENPQADLVIATVSSPSTATWSSVAAATQSASRYGSREANLLVVSDLQEPPGRALRLLGEHDTPWSALAALREERSADVLAAAQIARAQMHQKVYLRSSLDPAAVETLCLTPVESAEEVQNLASRANVVRILENADHVCVYDSPPQD